MRWAQNRCSLYSIRLICRTYIPTFLHALQVLRVLLGYHLWSCCLPISMLSRREWTNASDDEIRIKLRSFRRRTSSTYWQDLSSYRLLVEFDPRRSCLTNRELWYDKKQGPKNVRWDRSQTDRGSNWRLVAHLLVVSLLSQIDWGISPRKLLLFTAKSKEKRKQDIFY